MQSKLIVALDSNDEQKIIKLIEDISPLIDIFKVGLQAFCAFGPKIINLIHDKGNKVFLDLKLYDIPNTVVKAVEVGAKLNVYAMSIHLTGGKEMLKQAVQVNPRPRLWGVTVLTSLNDAELKNIGVNRTIKEQVSHLAKVAKTIGLDGVICSPQEISLMREICGDEFTIITPGIRPKKHSADDQKRILSPAEAIKQGADFIVIGRPILEAENPIEACQAILKEIGEIS